MSKYLHWDAWFIDNIFYQIHLIEVCFFQVLFRFLRALLRSILFHWGSSLECPYLLHTKIVCRYILKDLSVISFTVFFLFREPRLCEQASLTELYFPCQGSMILVCPSYGEDPIDKGFIWFRQRETPSWLWRK